MVLTRSIGQVIVIGEDIRVTILGVNGRQVRVGVAAPGDVVVDREEIWERKQAEEKPRP